MILSRHPWRCERIDLYKNFRASLGPPRPSHRPGRVFATHSPRLRRSAEPVRCRLPAECVAAEPRRSRVRASAGQPDAIANYVATPRSLRATSTRARAPSSRQLTSRGWLDAPRGRHAECDPRRAPAARRACGRGSERARVAGEQRERAHRLHLSSCRPPRIALCRHARPVSDPTETARRPSLRGCAEPVRSLRPRPDRSAGPRTTKARTDLDCS